MTDETDPVLGYLAGHGIPVTARTTSACSSRASRPRRSPGSTNWSSPSFYGGPSRRERGCPRLAGLRGG